MTQKELLSHRREEGLAAARRAPVGSAAGSPRSQPYGCWRGRRVSRPSASSTSRPQREGHRPARARRRRHRRHRAAYPRRRRVQRRRAPARRARWPRRRAHPRLGGRARRRARNAVRALVESGTSRPSPRSARRSCATPRRTCAARRPSPWRCSGTPRWSTPSWACSRAATGDGDRRPSSPADALGRLGDVRGLRELLAAWREGYKPAVVAEALRAMGPAAVEPLIDLVEAEPALADRKASSRSVLEQLPDQELAAALVARLADAGLDARVRRRARASTSKPRRRPPGLPAGRRQAPCSTRSAIPRPTRRW